MNETPAIANDGARQTTTARTRRRTGVRIILALLIIMGIGTLGALSRSANVTAHAPSSEPTPVVLTHTTGKEGCAVQLELMLVLDGSDSIGRGDPDDFNRVRSFARQVTARCSLSSVHARIEIGLSASAADVLRTIDAIVQIRGETDIQRGIALTQNELLFRGRPLDDAPRVLVVLTDGKANDGAPWPTRRATPAWPAPPSSPSASAATWTTTSSSPSPGWRAASAATPASCCNPAPSSTCSNSWRGRCRATSARCRRTTPSWSAHRRTRSCRACR